MSTNKLPDKPVMAESTSHRTASFFSVKELRKILGKDADGIDDRHLQEVSVSIGKISLMLTSNPDFISKITTSQNNKKG